MSRLFLRKRQDFDAIIKDGGTPQFQGYVVLGVPGSTARGSIRLVNTPSGSGARKSGSLRLTDGSPNYFSTGAPPRRGASALDSLGFRHRLEQASPPVASSSKTPPGSGAVDPFATAAEAVATAAEDARGMGLDNKYLSETSDEYLTAIGYRN